MEYNPIWHGTCIAGADTSPSSCLSRSRISWLGTKPGAVALSLSRSYRLCNRNGPGRYRSRTLCRRRESETPVWHQARPYIMARSIRSSDQPIHGVQCDSVRPFFRSLSSLAVDTWGCFLSLTFLGGALFGERGCFLYRTSLIFAASSRRIPAISATLSDWKHTQYSAGMAIIIPRYTPASSNAR